MTTLEDFARIERAAAWVASGATARTEANTALKGLRALWAEVQQLREDLRIAREDAEEQARELTRLTGMTYGSTHHDGCWDTVDARHHLCTLEKARELRAENERLERRLLSRSGPPPSTDS